jgi:two-component system, OmpR family, response regulator
MLVISRRVTEKILFPGIQATVEVIAVRGNVVRLGIAAPLHVAVMRDEVKDRPSRQAAMAEPAPQTQPLARELVHALRNRLNAAALGLVLLRKQHQLGLNNTLESTINKIEGEMDAIRRQLDGPLNVPQASAPQARRTRTALIVEDDQNERELLAAFLRMAGLDVEVAQDGRDALDYLHTHERPDVVLMDMSLPRCDGPTAIRAIRNDPAIADLKIFAVTGRTPDQFGDPKAMRVDRWFRKPLNAEDLLRDLHRDIADAN